MSSPISPESNGQQSSDSLQNTIESIGREPSTPTAEQVLDIIDFEINRITSEQQRPGWTPWALLGAIGGLLWLLISQLENPSLTLENIPTLFLSFSLFLDGALQIYSSLSPRQSESGRSTRFRLPLYFGEQRPLFLLEMARCLALLYITISTPMNVWWPQLNISSLFYGLGALLCLFALALSFFRLPMPAKNQSGLMTAILVLISTLILWSGWGYFSSVTLNSASLSFADLRAGALLVAIVFVVQRLLVGTSTSPLFLTLVDIRRDLTLGNIDVSTAARRADIAIAGMRVSDVLQEDVRAVLNLYDLMENDLDDKLRKYADIQSVMPENDAELTEAQFNKISEILDSITHERKNLFAKLTQQVKRFGTRAMWITRVSPESVAETSAVSSKITETFERLKKKFDELDRHMDVINSRLRGHTDEWARRRDDVLRRVESISKYLGDENSEASDAEVQQAKVELSTLLDELSELAEKWPSLTKETKLGDWIRTKDVPGQTA